MSPSGRPTACASSSATPGMHGRRQQAGGDEQGGWLRRPGQVARGAQAHVEQEESQHAHFEQIAGKGLHGLLACLAREQAHGHGAEQQQLGAVGEGFVQHFEEESPPP